MTRELSPQNVFMDRFLLEPKVQRVWDIPHATWFTLMGLGGGMFMTVRVLDLEGLLGTWLGLPVADLISFLAIAAGGLILIADLGKPMRFIRAVVNPRTSWISRGAIADFVFLTVGGLLVLPDLSVGSARPFSWLPWDASAGNVAGATLELITIAAAVIVTFYAGQVLANPRAIPYWNSPAIPLQFLLSSLALSMATVLVMEVANDRPVTAGQLWVLIAFLVGLAATIVWHLASNRDTPGKSHSLEELRRGRYRVGFLGGVLVAGTVAPAVLALVAIPATPARDALSVVILAIVVPAAFFLRLITLRVGIFPPVMQIPGPGARSEGARPSPARRSRRTSGGPAAGETT
jgi:formate-dependent nitrite reductase membrane component NrfD